MSDILYTDGYMSGKSEAADEIEALKAEIERLQAEIVLFTELQRASNQKIERLRAALKLHDDTAHQVIAALFLFAMWTERLREACDATRRVLDGEKG